MTKTVERPQADARRRRSAAMTILRVPARRSWGRDGRLRERRLAGGSAIDDARGPIPFLEPRTSCPDRGDRGDAAELRRAPVRRSCAVLKIFSQIALRRAIHAVDARSGPIPGSSAEPRKRDGATRVKRLGRNAGAVSRNFDLPDRGARQSVPRRCERGPRRLSAGLRR